jgi:hypothetical protein
MKDPINPMDRQQLQQPLLWEVPAVRPLVILSDEQQKQLTEALAELLLSSIDTKDVVTDAQEGIHDAK